MRIKTNHFLSLIFVCTCFIHSFGQDFSARESAVQLIQKGDAYLQLGNWFDALKEYTNAIETDPEYAEAYMKRGQLHERVYRIKQAEIDYNMAIQLNPVIDIYYNERARLKILSFDYYGAMNDINKAIDINVSNSNYLKYRVDGFIVLGMYDDALNNLDSILITSKNELYVLQHKTLIYILNGDITLAELTCLSALALNDSSYLTLDLLGLINLKNKKYKDAVTWFSKAIIADSSQFVSYYNRGVCYRFLENPELALKDINTSIRFNNKAQDLYFKRALLKKENGDFEGSISDYNNAIILDSNYSEAVYNRAFTYKIMGDYWNAEKDIDLLIKNHNSRPEYWNMKGNLQILHGNIKEALLSYNQAIYSDLNYSQAYYNRGVANLLLNRQIQACEDFQESLNLGSTKAESIILHFCGY